MGNTRPIRISPGRALGVGVAAVAASSAAFPWVTGYGTVLFQRVAFGAWTLVADLTSGTFADLHHGPVWFVALVLNVGFFLFPALIVFFLSQKRWPKLGSAGLLAWTAFYLLCLFVLFPATDGP